VKKTRKKKLRSRQESTEMNVKIGGFTIFDDEGEEERFGQRRRSDVGFGKQRRRGTISRWHFPMSSKALRVTLLLVLTAIVIRGLVMQPQTSVCEFVKTEVGLECEEHTVTTPDGYTLFLKRIPRPGRPPVALMPGIVISSTTFLLTGRHESLAGVLVDQDFEVWLLEKRGRMPWRHEKYSSQDLEFWDFTFEESVSYDLPVMIDYIKRFTGRDIASLIGHNEGALISMAALAANKELEKQVKSVVGLGATISWENKWGIPEPPEWIVQSLHPGIIWGLLRIVLTGTCGIVPRFCIGMVCSVGGCSDESIFDDRLLMRIFTQVPRETSLKNLKHMLQLDKAGRLQKYDYGTKENMKRYGTEVPPEMDLSGLALPTLLIYGEHDSVIPPAAHNQIDSSKARNLTVPLGHLELLWSKDAKDLVYDRIIEFIKDE